MLCLSGCPVVWEGTEIGCSHPQGRATPYCPDGYTLCFIRLHPIGIRVKFLKKRILNLRRIPRLWIDWNILMKLPTDRTYCPGRIRYCNRKSGYLSGFWKNCHHSRRNFRPTWYNVCYPCVGVVSRKPRQRNCELVLYCKFLQTGVVEEGNGRIHRLLTHFHKHKESNLHLVFRRDPFYPLNYGDRTWPVHDNKREGLRAQAKSRRSMPCIVILNSIHQDNFYGFLKLPVSPPFSAHPWPNTAIVPITCRKRPRIMK